jgi:hypothetical protein
MEMMHSLNIFSLVTHWSVDDCSGTGCVQYSYCFAGRVKQTITSLKTGQTDVTTNNFCQDKVVMQAKQETNKEKTGQTKTNFWYQ